MIASISAEHGGPTSDTGWITDSEACRADAQARVVWWSDLRIVAERTADSTVITGWSFGDPQAAPNVPSGAGPTSPSLGLVADGNVTLGDAREDVRSTLADGTVTSEDAERIVVSSGSRALVFLFGTDGRLSGIGSEDGACTSVPPS